MLRSQRRSALNSTQFMLPLLLSAVLLLMPAKIMAGDTWTNVAPGIDHLHRTTSEPQDYHVVLVDLSLPEIRLRATGPGENGRRTSAFAADVGAIVAINGDLWDADNWSAYEPLGLAVGEGFKWSDDTDVWSFLACDVTKKCWYDPWGHFAEHVPRAFNAIGGMQDLLVIDGEPQYYNTSFHNSRHPRTATGVSHDGSVLILLVADGRRTGALGMTFADMTDVMMEFGAWNAMNSDGGGSSTMVVSGSIKNVPSDGAERVVANHLAVIVSGHIDENCVGVENSRLCIDETRMRTCTGGVDLGIGDCAYYGMTCETDNLFAFCVDPRCKNSGNAAFCLDETRIAFCEDGRYFEGNCAGYGLPCVEGFGTAWCRADFRKAEPIASSLGAPDGGIISMTLGEEVLVWFELRNDGHVPWIPGVTILAPIPRDVESPLEGPDWIAPHRAATISGEVLPGEIGRFTFTVAPQETGEHILPLGILDETITWFADPPAGGGPEDGELSVTLVVDDQFYPSGDGGVPSDARNETSNGEPAGETDVIGKGCGCHAPGNRKSGPASQIPISALLGLLCFLKRRSDAPSGKT